MPGSVIVKKQEVRNPERLKALERFEILYTSDFNPNSSNFISFRQNVEKEHLGTYLVSLCKYFYERKSEEKFPIEHVNSSLNIIAEKTEIKMVDQCKHCFTIYDERFGDAENNIPAGTTFDDLPESYQCPLCEAGKEDFIAVDATKLQFQKA